MNPAVSIQIDHATDINFAYVSNGQPIIHSIRITNRSGQDLEDVLLTIACDSKLCEPYERKISILPAGETLTIPDVELKVNAQLLAANLEAETCTLTLRLTCDGRQVAAAEASVHLQEYEHWLGCNKDVKQLAAFIMPNHPDVIRIVAQAARFMEQWTGDPTMAAYLRGPEHVLQQAAAIYAAIQKENIVYMIDPPSFEVTGQRIRLCDTIIRTKTGCCIDMSLLFCACLEHVGLHPLNILVKGHSFGGVWLEEKMFPEAVSYDPALLQKLAASGVNGIAVVECTYMNAGRNCSFDDARRSAEGSVAETENFRCVLDVARARISGIHPMPMRIVTANGFEIVRPQRPDSEVSRDPDTGDEKIDLSDLHRQTITKQLQWERKLLDLSLRNGLLNLHMKRSVVPLLTPSCDALETCLRSHRELPLLCAPEEFKPGEDKDLPESYAMPDSLRALVQTEMNGGRLRASLTETAMERAVKGLYRNSKLSIDETGANSLYLAMGFLKWFDTEGKKKPHHAPLVLLPAELVRKSAGKGYTLQLRDEECMVNVTLLEKLRQDHKLHIDGLVPLPTDPQGRVDYRKVFAIVRTACMEHTGWTVVEQPVLGNFSFGQFAMWNDVRTRTDALAGHPITASLIQGRLAWDARPLRFDADSGNFYTPLPSDASQMAAIAAAIEGLSFVLHGPPGTGKSQTITNMIVNLIAAGKRVLVVAEKMAALEVLLQRLKKLGLSDFCLELHSNRTTVRSMLDQLYRTTQITAGNPPAAYAQKAENIAKLRKQLDGHLHRLHKVLPCGLTLYQLIEQYERNCDAKNIAPMSNDVLEAITPARIDEMTLIVHQLVAAAKAIGHPKDHPLQSVTAREYNITDRVELQRKLTDFIAAAETCRDHAARLAGTVRQEIPSARAQYVQLLAIAGELQIWSGMRMAAWAAEPQLETRLVEMQDTVNHFKNAAAARRNLIPYWKDSFLALNGAELYAEHRRLSRNEGLTHNFRLKSFLRTLQPHAIEMPAFEQLWVHLNNLTTYNREMAAANACLDKCRSLFGDLYQGDATRWDQVEELIMDARRQLERGRQFPALARCRAEFAGNAQALSDARNCLAAWKAYNDKRQALDGCVQLNDSAPDWLEAQIRRCRESLGELPQLREWIAYLHQTDRAREAGLTPLLDAYAAGMDHDDVLPAFRKSLYFSLANAHIMADGELNHFSGPVFDTIVAQFRADEAKMREATIEEVFCRAAAHLPDFTRLASESTEFTLLNRAFNGSGCGKSIRQLFEQMPALIPQLAPCMLMSPSSAAQYLPDCIGQFDVVIFDEASQLQTCKAVGALSRAKSAIIVGDPRQMPPTTFFAADVHDEDNPDIEDLESVLDDCLAVNMPQSHLQWHYRSHHESLIAFSNHQFYEDRLLTFPSVNDLETRVRLVPVEGGVFERSGSRTNRAEAQAVVDELIRRSRDATAKAMSVGVVTFNQPQQHLIDDLVSAACRNDEAFEQWVNREGESLFIKNLENVQGDERDVILFSVGYGPDANGNVYMNFGPLNRDGGWRRLNVAVTRARDEMVVFSTLRPEQINLSRSSAKGVSAMRAFLEYAGARSATREVSAGAARHADRIADSICTALQARGWKTRRAVGTSRFRIDVGVLDPANEQRYLLGVMLDGPIYSQEGQTTRDREIGRVQVLENLGWKTHRVYALDWWDDRDREIDRIEAHLRSLAPHAAAAGD